MRLALVLVALAGCSPVATSQAVQVQGPSAADQERALQIVWERVYGMTRDTRPAIAWWAPCPDATGDSGCADEYSTPGDVNLVWTGPQISDTHFSAWLEGNREWIVYPSGELAPEAEADRLTQSAQDALRAAGL